MSTQNLKFIHLSTGSASAHKADTGAIIFEKATGRIAVATGANTDVEYYGGGRIADATFKNSILTLSFNDGGEAITLDFSDVASTSGVNKILGALRTDVDALKTTVNGTDKGGSHTPGLVDKVAANETAIQANANAIDLINHETNGILAKAKGYTDTEVKKLKDSHDTLLQGLRNDVNSNDTDIAALQALHADKNASSKKTVKEEIDAKVGAIGGTVEDYVKGEVGKINTAAETLGGRVTALETTVGKAAANGESATGLHKDIADLSALHKDGADGKMSVAEEVTAGVNAKVGEIGNVTVQAYVDGKDTAVRGYIDSKVSTINGVTDDLRKDLGVKTADAGTDTAFGRIKALEGTVSDHGTKITTLIGEDADKSVRTISAEEVAKVVAGADTSYDTLKEIADWITNDTTGAAKMANDISNLKTSVGEPAKGEVAATGLHKDIADNKSAIKALQDAQASGSLMWSVWE